MPSETSSETVAAILATARKVGSLRKITKEVTAMGYPASYGTVRRILRKDKDTTKGVHKKPKEIPPQNTRPHHIKSIEKKVFKDIDKPNPPSQRQMAKK
ncbi:hypothetical protein RvY_16404 [Ramazzottius varieornatus]|uniref:Uncharacterized protein n=1 Tax=Ramazzottius varieornatus TaxID=947166 RepID=A0A1D1VYB3_RAMVA|nr:hypothetical protein RvY_16404 [Ramazzottius varieornatus]